MSAFSSNILSALTGGAVVGLASVLMLLFNGRILGISGIVGGLFSNSTDSRQWRVCFVLGLLAGGVLAALWPGTFEYSLQRSQAVLIAAGLLVGFGTRLGNGCTSGHGVCGVSRLSPRSLIATMTFMAAGAAVVFFINHVLGGRL